METIHEALKEIQKRSPGLILTDGESNWAIERLVEMAREDKKNKVLGWDDPVYSYGYTGDGRISVSANRPGHGAWTILTEPKEGLVREGWGGREKWRGREGGTVIVDFKKPRKKK